MEGMGLGRGGEVGGWGCFKTKTARQRKSTLKMVGEGGGFVLLKENVEGKMAERRRELPTASAKCV